MIQGHTLDALLAPVYRTGLFYDAWLFLRGLTAPMFFLLAGIAFSLSTVRHWQSHQSFSPVLFRRLRRFTCFIALGYLLHWPVRTFSDFRFLNDRQLKAWLESDVLQCIGVTLILAQVLVGISGSTRRFGWVTATLGAAIVALAPAVWSSPGLIQDLPLWFVSYLSGHTGSWFPLFPWAGFVLIGCAIGIGLARNQEAGYAFPWKPLATGATLCIVGGYALLAGLPLAPGDNSPADLWKISPGFFLARLGAVGLMLSLIGLLSTRINLPVGILRAVSDCSLPIYMIHVCILYGCAWQKGLADFIGASLAPNAALLWIFILVTSMMVLAWVWQRVASLPARFHE